ncbi:hypothetical protein FSARC_1072 [Fusarium sarcochroum]|uniref:Uncharacterized protein n=1 Tax=Fusarium sarcochroum TaxID=1208366 RepID=A0A8H4XFC8_9HYPO|nr:hypothetical protein FSARC_1072 [Fusarium sarcochroum]
MCHITTTALKCEDCHVAEPTTDQTIRECQRVKEKKPCRGYTYTTRYRPFVCMECHQERAIQNRNNYTWKPERV